MATRETKVKLTAQVQQYITDMERAAKATDETGSATDKLAQQKSAFEQMGRASMVAGGLIAAGLVVATKAAMDWESAWAGVTKTVDGSDQEMAALEGQLRGLASVLPATHTEIAAVAEAAGQLGIERENVASFTKTMIDLGETTNLSAEQAATSLAQLMNIMGTSQVDVDRLGATIVALGNAGASTESEIVEMAQRIAGAGKLVGASEGEVLGLANALASMGVSAELGGGVASRVLQDLYSAVQTGGASLEAFAQVAGMTGRQFAAAFEEDPVRALDAFAKGLNGVEASGGNVVQTLSDLGFKSTEEQRVLLQLKGAGDLLADSLDLQARAWKENSALTDEAAKRYETTEAKVAIMTNRINDAVISLGEKLLPAVQLGAEGIGSFAEALGSLDGPMAGVTAWGGLLASGALIGYGAFVAAVPKVAEYRVALETLGGTTQRVAGLLGQVGRAAGLAAMVVVVSEAAVALADWSAKAAGTAAVADDLANSLQRSSMQAQEMNRILAANSMRRLWDIDSAAVDNLKSLNTTMGDLQATFEATDVGKIMTMFNQLGMGGQLGRAKENIVELDAALSQMVASGDIDAAARAYEEFSAKAEEAGWSTEKITAAFPEYLAALKEAGPETKSSADAASEAASSYMDQANAARAAADELFGLIDALMESNGVAQDAEGANARYQQTLADVAESIASAHAGVEGFSASIDASTVAGSKNREMFAGLAADSQVAADAMYQQEISTLGVGQATENYSARLSAGRDALIEQITALTGNRDAAVELADQIYAMPSEYELQITADTALAAAQIDEIDEKNPPDKLFRIAADAAAAYAGIDGVNVAVIDDKTAYVWGDNADATAKIGEINAKQTPRKIVEIGANDSGFWSAWNSIAGLGSITKIVNFVKGTTAENADGGMYGYRALDAMNRVSSFDRGGFAPGIYRGGTPIHKFAEPETLWEAYISGKPDQRDRNREIWVSAGERLGMGEEIMKALSGHGGGAQIGTVKVVGHRGMDIDQLAEKVLRKIEGNL